MNYIRYTKLREYTKLLSNLIWCFFTSSTLTMRKSAKKQQSQVQTIQRTATIRNVAHDIDNINNFWKGSRLVCVNAWGPFVISYDQSQENGCLENYVCVRAFKHSLVPIDHVFCTRCMYCLLQSWRFQLTVLPRQTMQNTYLYPANHAKSAKHIVNYLSHVFFLRCTHLL